MASTSAIIGGGLGGAGSGAAIGTALGGPGIGTAIGAGVGILSGLFSSNEEEKNRKMQMLLRAAEQREAPYLARAGVKTELTPYAMGKTHGADIFNGALSGFDSYQKAQQAKDDNEYRTAMKNLMMSQTGKSTAGGVDPGLLDLASQYMKANKGSA